MLRTNHTTILGNAEEVKASLDAWGAAEENETIKDFSQALEDGDTEKEIGNDSIQKLLTAQGIAGEPVAMYTAPELHQKWDVNTWLSKELEKPKEPNVSYGLMDLAADIVKAKATLKDDLLKAASCNMLWSIQCKGALEELELMQRYEKILQWMVESESKRKLKSIEEDNKQ